MHAEIARELLVGGDPFALTLNGVRYVDKPPLFYALLAAAFRLAGPGEAAARAVPALAALAAVAGTAWAGARLAGTGAGLLAGLALLGSPGFLAFARYVRPESLFVAALAWGFGLVLVGFREARRGLVTAGLATFGLAALAKDPLGALAPPLAVALAVTLARRLRPLGRWLPWPGLAAALVLGFGWWALAEARTPGFVWYTVVDNHVLNVLGARRFPDEDVPLGAGAFLLVALAGAAPWALAAAATVGRLARRRAWADPAEVPWTALALWAVGVLGLTALSAFRLPHYGLPAYPAIALLAARAWREGGRGLALAHAALLAVAALGAAFAWAGQGEAVRAAVLGVTDVATRKSVLGSAAAPPWELLRPLAGATAAALAGGAVLAVGGALHVERPRARWLAGLGVAVALLGVLPSVATALGRVAAHRSVRGLALELARQAGPGDLVVHEGPLENSGALAWYARRRPVIVDGGRSVLAFGARRPEGHEILWDAGRVRAAWAGPRRVWLVSVRAPERSLAARLPGARLVATGGGRTLWVNRTGLAKGLR